MRFCRCTHAGKESCSAEGGPPLGGLGAYATPEIFKSRVSEMPLPAFSAGYFQEIYT